MRVVLRTAAITAAVSAIPFSWVGGAGELDPQNRYGLPAFYELHVWARKHNPSGMFEDWNPTVSC